MCVLYGWKKLIQHHWGQGGKYFIEDMRRYAADLPSIEDEYKRDALDGEPGLTAHFGRFTFQFTTHFRRRDVDFTFDELKMLHIMSTSNDGSDAEAQLHTENGIFDFGKGPVAVHMHRVAERLATEERNGRLFKLTASEQARELLKLEKVPGVDAGGVVVPRKHASTWTTLTSVRPVSISEIRFKPQPATDVLGSFLEPSDSPNLIPTTADLDAVAFRGKSIKLATHTMDHLIEYLFEEMEVSTNGGDFPSLRPLSHDAFVEYEAPDNRPWFTVAELIRLIGYHATHNMSKLSVVGVMFPDDDPNYLRSLRQFGALTKLEHDNCDDVYCPVWVFRPSEDAVEQYQARVAEFALVGKDGSVNATESLANSSTFQGLTAVPM